MTTCPPDATDPCADVGGCHPQLAEHGSSISEQQIQTFWNRLWKPDGPSGCWEWVGYCQPKGYGRLTLNRKTWAAHRLAYFIAFGDLGQLCVCHSCDNPKCCNPAHLWLGTNKSNHLDSVQKNRRHRPIGERNPSAKLTEKHALEIRRLLAEGLQQSIIAARFGVSRQLVGQIGAGTKWGHIN